MDSLPLDTIMHGDCLALLRTLPDACVDAVVTDPPYMIGAISAGNKDSKSGTWADMENAAYWFAAWFAEAERILKPTGYLVTFGNWRSLPTLIRALSLVKLPATSCMVWDKQWIGPSAQNQLRPRYELAVFTAMPDANIPNRSAADIYACKWLAGNMRTTPHPAEKPVELMAHICRLIAPIGGVIVDPFAGSGTTLLAAKLSGMRYIGMERESEWVELAQRRLERPVAPRRNESSKRRKTTAATLWEASA